MDVLYDREGRKAPSVYQEPRTFLYFLFIIAWCAMMNNNDGYDAYQSILLYTSACHSVALVVVFVFVVCTRVVGENIASHINNRTFFHNNRTFFHR